MLTIWPGRRRKLGTRKRKAGRLGEARSARTDDRQALDVQGTAGTPRWKPGCVARSWRKAVASEKLLRCIQTGVSYLPPQGLGKEERELKRGSTVPGSGEGEPRALVGSALASARRLLGSLLTVPSSCCIFSGTGAAMRHSIMRLLVCLSPLLELEPTECRPWTKPGPAGPPPAPAPSRRCHSLQRSPVPTDKPPANLLSPLCPTHPSAPLAASGCQQALLSEGRAGWNGNSDASLSASLFSTRPPRVTGCPHNWSSPFCLSYWKLK